MATVVSSLADLRARIPDEFSRTALDGVSHALGATGNPLRLNLAATAFRILLEHLMEALAPKADVERCSWFRSETDSGEPSRGQRAMYAIQGGLTDDFVREKLKLDPSAIRKPLADTYAALSKHVHARENTVVRDEKNQDQQVEEIVAFVNELLDTIKECRDKVVDLVAERLDSHAVDALMAETILEVDELASHHTIEEIYVHKVTVVSIDARTIHYRATGSISVGLQWGSNSDVRNGDGAELDQSFPFRVDFTLPVDDPWNLELAETTYGVDTSEWTDAMEPDEDDL